MPAVLRDNEETLLHLDDEQGAQYSQCKGAVALTQPRHGCEWGSPGMALEETPWLE